MDSYRKALAEYLEPADRTQAKLAEAVGLSQVAVSRYLSGARFPDSAIAREIERATEGAVPFAIWQEDASKRFGIEPPSAEAA